MKFLLLILFPVMAQAASYYVSPSASAGTGSFADPWSITNAFTNRTVITSGDTVWLRGGTYQKTNLFTVTLYAVSNNPIVIRNYNNERAIIDGGLLLTTSSNVWFWGIEVIDSGRTNKPNPTDTISGQDNYGVKFINCLIHDTCIGLAGGPYEAYGNVMWNNGKVSTEHAIYWQNDDPLGKEVAENLVGYSSGFGFHSFASAGHLSNLRFVGNAVWNSGAPLNDSKAAIFVNGEKSITNLVVDANNVVIATRGIEFGSSYSNRSARITSNKVFSGRPFYQRQHFDILTVTNNTFGHQDDGVWIYGTPFFNVGPYTWDWNTYWSARFPNHDIQTNGTEITFATWQSITGFDSNSTLTQNQNVSNFLNTVEVRVNRYEPRRANILVWNFQSNHNVSVTLSGVAAVGDAYTIRNAQDWFGGVWSGIYGGSVTLPMTNLSVAQQLYWDTAPAVNVSTAPRFAAFVVTTEAGGSKHFFNRPRGRRN